MKTIFITFLTMIISYTSFSGNEGDEKNKPVLKEFTFKVVDSYNESIVGAEIEIESLGLKAYSDMDGNVNIKIPISYEDKLKVSFISFEDRKLDVNSITNGKIILKEE